MQKISKEQLAAMLDGCEYHDGIADEIVQSAKDNNLVIIHGASDDLVELKGAIDDEDDAYSLLHISRHGIPKNECDCDCVYFKRWLDATIQRGEVREIKAFWCGEHNNETMDEAKYAAIGEPTWCYETTMPHAVFKMFHSEGYGGREYYCRGIVIDLDEVWPRRTYAQIVMEQGDTNNDRH
jgi:hypothetical protein